jgi:hypothetical protein
MHTARAKKKLIGRIRGQVQAVETGLVEERGC